MKRKIRIVGFFIFILLAIAGLASTSRECEKLAGAEPGTARQVSADCCKSQKEGSAECCFSKSLHYTGGGMRYWYEEPNGLMGITQVPYEQLACKGCHVSSCDQCHAKKEGGKCSYSVEKAKDIQTCLPCHARAKATFAIGKDKGSLDVHIAAGMACADCHKGGDVHGDGTSYRSMNDEGAMSASCTNCHKPKENEIRPHTVHKGRLDCLSCHVSNSMSCLNCHIDSFVKTGKKEGNFLPPIQDWLLLVNYKGKVTSGSVQTAVYNGKKFIAYAPYFTHAIQAKAKDCADCHGNAATRLIQKDQPVPMAEFKEGKMVSWQGVVPLVPEKLQWSFLDKVGDEWVAIDSNEPPKIQFVGYGEPLTKEQVKKMGMPFKK